MKKLVLAAALAAFSVAAAAGDFGDSSGSLNINHTGSVSGGKLGITALQAGSVSGSSITAGSYVELSGRDASARQTSYGVAGNVGVGVAGTSGRCLRCGALVAGSASLNVSGAYTHAEGETEGRGAYADGGVIGSAGGISGAKVKVVRARYVKFEDTHSFNLNKEWGDDDEGEPEEPEEPEDKDNENCGLGEPSGGQADHCPH